jgi:hypothetical protein
MYLDRVKSQRFGIRRRLRERPDRFGNIVFRHRNAADFSGCDAARRAFKRGRRPPAGILGSHHAHMPELRGHDATGCMHLVNHGLPSTERLLAIKTGDVRIIGRRGAIDHRAF